MRKPTHKNLDLTPEELTALRGLARDWNFTIGRGPMAADGSIDELNHLLAAGDALFVPLADDTEYHPMVSAKLRELAERENFPLLARVATALDRASKLHELSD